MSKKEQKETMELEEINIRKGHLWQIDTTTKKHKKKKGKGSYNRKEEKFIPLRGILFLKK